MVSESSSGSSSGSGSGARTGNGRGSGSGSGMGPNSGSNPGSGKGYYPGPGSTTTGAGQPSDNPTQSKPTAQSASLLPWMYGILGIITAAIISSGVWIARRRMKKAPSQVPVTAPSV